MLKIMAAIFGIVMLIIGVLGFIPALFFDGKLIGLFDVNAIHNIIHLLTGAISLWVSLTSHSASKMFFQVFGVIYGIVAVLGFFYGNTPILGLIANNWNDVWLHLIIAIFALYLGFGYKEASSK